MLTVQRVSHVARLMKRHKLTSAQVEEICGVSRQTVHAWRTGRKFPSLDNVGKLIKALWARGIRADWADFVRRAA